MNKSNSLLFFGNERLSTGFELHGAPVLQSLIDQGYDVKAVVANHEEGQSRKKRTLEVEIVAKKHNIPVLLPKKLTDIKDELIAFHADAAVLVAYGRMIPQSVIDIFPFGILNIHPSLLPHYRGSTPIEQAILDGTTTTGVSIMKLVREMDAGPLYAQQKIQLTGNETKQELTERLLNLGQKLVIDVVPRVLQGTLTPEAQNEAQATFTTLITKSDGIIDLTKSAEQLERQVRAFATWPKSRTQIFEQDVIVTKSRVAQNAADGALILTCNPGWLEVLELIAPSGKKITGEDFIRGYRKL